MRPHMTNEFKIPLFLIRYGRTFDKMAGFLFKKMRYLVYALVKDEKPVYIGVTANLYKRISAHKSDKDFDNVIIICSKDNRKDAYLAENSIIRFITLFTENQFYNGADILLSYERQTRIKKQ